MKILDGNRALSRMLALSVCCFLSALSMARGAVQAVPVPASPEAFDIESGGKAEFGEFLGRRAIDLPAGLLNVKGAKFRDGTVEVDVASKPRGLFLGLAFRVESAANMEVVYLRPSASDTIEALQYTPRLNGDAIWQLLNSSHEKAAAHLPVNEWVHLKIVVRGRTCQVFVGDGKVPTLAVTNLRRGDSEGGIGLWALGGGGYFSNLRYQALARRRTKPLSSQPPRFQRAGLLTDWELSPAFDSGDVDASEYPPAAILVHQWEKVHAEAPGFVLVNRYRASPAMFPMPPREEMRKGRVKGAKVVFARTTLLGWSSAVAKDGEQPRVLKIGYSDDIVVYLNRKPVFSGKNALTYRDNGALGVFGLNDEIPIQLQPGENELLVAVTEYNGGWAFECELQRPAASK